MSITDTLKKRDETILQIDRLTVAYQFEEDRGMVESLNGRIRQLQQAVEFFTAKIEGGSK